MATENGLWTTDFYEKGSRAYEEKNYRYDRI